MEFDEGIYLQGKNGEVIECEVLLTYEEDDHTYVAYTDKTLYNDEILKSYVSEVVKEEDSFKLLEVNDMVLLRKIQDKLDELTPQLLEEKRKLSEEYGA